MKQLLSQIFQTKKGFTVIEAFVGITILLIGLVGPLMLVNTNLQAGRFSRDQITAYYLAQEAIEIVREERDENFLEGNEWLSGTKLSLCLNKTGDSGCRIDGRDGDSDFIACSGCDTLAGNNMLEINETTGEYGYNLSGGSDSRFYRYLQVDETDSGDGALVRVFVGFDTGRYIQEYETTDYIRDWSPR